MRAEIPQRERLCFICSGSGCLPECLFVNIPDAESKARVRVYSSDCTVFRQGESATSIYVLRSGWIKETHLSSTGKRITRVLSPGSAMGVEAVITNTPHEVSADTIHESELICISDWHFLHLLQAHPHLTFELLRRTSRKLQSAQNDLFDFAGKKPGSQRLLESLQHRAESSSRSGDYGVKLNLPCSMQDLADGIGCSRQWAFRLFRQLEDEGIACRKGSWITLLTPKSREAAVRKSGTRDRFPMMAPVLAEERGSKQGQP